MALLLHKVSVIFLASELSLLGDKDVLCEKFKLEVVSNTEADLDIKLKVNEGGDYERLGPNLDAYKLLVTTKFNHDSMTLILLAKCHLLLDDFTYLMDVSAPSTSVVVTGHTWCSISAVHCQIWVQGVIPIDVNIDDGPNVVHEFDISLIMQHNPTFPIKLNWDHCHNNFLIAAKETVHAQYIQWYHDELKKLCKLSQAGQDSDSSYTDSGTSQSDDSHDDRPYCNTHTRKKQRTSNLDRESVMI
ncbi:hypothetical protein BDR06DRAFT_977769 [Suillus hirtellus]|nr:hypothetical protein BDR06DRAFT_977769 [Suillus hirtellus]